MESGEGELMFCVQNYALTVSLPFSAQDGTHEIFLSDFRLFNLVIWNNPVLDLVPEQRRQKNGDGKVKILDMTLHTSLPEAMESCHDKGSITRNVRGQKV